MKCVLSISGHNRYDVSADDNDDGDELKSKEFNDRLKFPVQHPFK